MGQEKLLKELPSLDQFDHMIVRAAGPGGGRFVDCTDKGADMAAAPPALAGYEVFILDEKAPRLATIPPLAAESSTLTVRQHVRLTNLSDAVVEETMELTGAHAGFLRNFLREYSPTYRQMAMQREFGMADADVSDFKVEALDRPGEPLRLQFSFALRKAFHQVGERLSGKALGGFERDYLTASAVDGRMTPFELRVPLSFAAMFR